MASPRRFSYSYILRVDGTIKRVKTVQNLSELDEKLKGKVDFLSAETFRDTYMKQTLLDLKAPARGEDPPKKKGGWRKAAKKSFLDENSDSDYAHAHASEEAPCQEFMFLMSADNDLPRLYQVSTLQPNKHFSDITLRARILGDVWVGKCDSETDDVLSFKRSELLKVLARIHVARGTRRSRAGVENPWEIRDQCYSECCGR